MTNTTNSASRRITAPQVLTFPAARRRLVRLVGPPESRRRTVAVAAGWWALTLLVLLPTCAFLRSRADNVGLPVYGSGAETTLFGTLPTLTLQHWLWDGSQLVAWVVA